FVDRADGAVTVQDLSWGRRIEVLPYTSAEINGDMLDVVRGEFRRRKIDSDDRIANYVRTGPPVIGLVVIQQPVTGQLVDDIYEVEQRFDGFRLIVLSGPEMGQEPPAASTTSQRIVFIRPELPPGLESWVLQEIHDLKSEPAP